MIKMTRHYFLLQGPLLGLLLLAGAHTALAQTLDDKSNTPAGKKPIDIRADRLDVDQNASTAIFSGNVKVVQDTTTLTSQKMTAYYSSSAQSGTGNGITQIIATGGEVKVVRINNGVEEIGTGTNATYKPPTQILTLTAPRSDGGVTLTRAGNVLHGTLLTYNLATSKITLTGGGTVTGHFQSGSPNTSTSGGFFPTIKATTPAAKPLVSSSVPLYSK